MNKKIIIISFIALAGISISFVAYNQTQYQDPYSGFIQKTPNQFNEYHDRTCDGGYQVSGTDKYGFGWAGCFFEGCEYDESIVGDYMRCVVVTLIE